MANELQIASLTVADELLRNRAEPLIVEHVIKIDDDDDNYDPLWHVAPAGVVPQRGGRALCGHIFKAREAPRYNYELDDRDKCVVCIELMWKEIRGG